MPEGNVSPIVLQSDLQAIDTSLGVIDTSLGTIQTDLTTLQASITAMNAILATLQYPTYKHATFDAAASGNLVVAVADKVIKVHAITIQAQGTVTVNINDGNGGASLAEWSFQAREGVAYAFALYPAHWFQTSVNTILYVTLSAGVTTTINVIYTDSDVS